MKIVIGSRGSKLALWQANWVKDQLVAAGHTVEIKVIKTTGDKLQRSSPSKPLPPSVAQAVAEAGAKGLFIKEIEEALRAGQVDVAVHSLKDLPTAQPEGLLVAAVPPREDARDVFISRNGGTFTALPSGARIGTSSLRREAQLRALRSDVVVIPLRGNLDTRLRKLERGDCEALVLAAAGVHRLGLAARVSAYFSLDEMCPAVGQGALAIEVRQDDSRTRAAIEPLDHAPTHRAVRAERAVLARLGGGCQVPIAAYAQGEDGQLRLRGVVGSPSGGRIIRSQASGSFQDPEGLGAAVAEELLRLGAREILNTDIAAKAPGLKPPGVIVAGEAAHLRGQLNGSERRPLFGKRIVVTRRREQADALSGELSALGAEVVEVPTIEIRDPASWEPLDAAIRRLEEFDYLLVTSANGVRNFLVRLKACGRDVRHLKGLTIGAIGPATAAEFAKAGIKGDLLPREYRAEGLLEALSGRDVRGKAFLIPRAKVARDLVPRVLAEKGARVEVVEAYETVVPELPREELDRLFTPPPDAITFTSSSTAQNFAKLVGEDRVAGVLRGIAIASIGPVTSETVRRLGLTVTIEASESTLHGLVRALQEHFQQV